MQKMDLLPRIPKDWRKARVKEIIKIDRGKKPEKLHDSKQVKTFLPYLTMDYLRGEVNEPRYARKGGNLVTVNKNDILLLWDGSKAGEFIKSKKGIVSSTMARARVRKSQKDTVNKDYLYYILKAVVEPFLQKFVNGMGIPHVDKNVLNNLKIPIPPKKTQDSTVGLMKNKLGNINDILTERTKLNGILKEKRQALINKAVTQGGDDDVAMKDSGVEWLGKIPKAWELKKLKFVAPLRQESTNADEISEYIELDNIEQQTGRLKDKNTGTPSGKIAKFYPGDVLFNKLRPYLAKALAPDFQGGCVNEVLVLKPIKGMNSEYLKFLTLSKAFVDLVDSATYGVKMPRASWDFVGDIKIPVPPVEMQEDIAYNLKQKLGGIDRMIEKNEEAIAKLEEYKESLTHHAVTGKIDVRNFDSTGEE